MQPRRLLNSFIEDIIANNLQTLENDSLLTEYEVLNNKCDMIMSKIKKRKDKQKEK